MPISVRCTNPDCNKTYRVKNEFAGKSMKCPGCGQSIAIPGLSLDDDEPVKPAPKLPKPQRVADPERRSTQSKQVKSRAPESPAPVELGASPVRWLLRLGLSAIAALIVGAIGYEVANAGFMRKMDTRTDYSQYGGIARESGSGTLWFFGIQLLKSDNLEEFREQSNRIGLLIVRTAFVVFAFCGGGLAFLSLGRLTRRSRPAGVWPKFIGVTVLLLACAGGGYYIFSSLTEMSNDRKARADKGKTQFPPIGDQPKTPVDTVVPDIKVKVLAKPEPGKGIEQQPLPADVRAAWEKADASAGWMYLDEGTTFYRAGNKSEPGDVPAFRFHRWRPGVVGTLPAPQQEFGIDLSNTEVNDAGLKELTAFKQLRWLNLNGVKITDAGLTVLAGLKELQWLNLDFTQVTDAGLKELAALRQLKMLALRGTKVTSAGLKFLTGQAGIQVLADQPLPVMDVSNQKPPTGPTASATERVLDYIIAHNAIGILTEDKVARWAMHRFAAGDEPMELRLARCFVIHHKATYPTIEVDHSNIKTILKARLEMELRLAMDDKYVGNIFKASRSGLILEGAQKVREPVDMLEKSFNASMTAAMAKDIARAAAMIREATGQELLNARKKMKEQWSTLIQNDPEIIKLFEASNQTTDEVRASRERVNRMIKEAAGLK